MSIDRLLADRMTVPDDLGATERLYRIFVRNLVLPCRIGVYAHEHERPQQVRFAVELLVRRPTEPLNDDISKVLSYDDVIDGLRRLTTQGHINLVETLAEAIAQMCLADDRVEHVRAIVEKLEILPGEASVGVEVERRQFTNPGAATVFPLPGGGPRTRSDD